ncbi:DNA-processing protein DprA [Aliarcobacter cryaerophilus]|uniref:DNA-processing protein DprA n=1 Tax=Aliarcobacter cryaerophilus TaxID=28198 RepID=UPI00112F310F|nr:DNA-processing protein DprA [Aliarcobacter cryaerophilus]
MINQFDFKIKELENMKKYPKELYFIGNTELLKRKKISIVGTRRPSNYTKEFTYKLASKLSQNGICIVSGAAMGVDSIAHSGAGLNNTIAVVANGLDIRYPSVNKNQIIEIEKNGLIISSFKEGEKARLYSFVQRNEIVVALGDKLIVTQADLNSGSMTSVEFAIKQNKEIFVLPHRINESLATNELIKKGLAKAIYDIDEFIEDIVGVGLFGFENSFDEILEYCKSNSIYDEVLLKYPDKILEYELDGKIAIKDGKVFVL